MNILKIKEINKNVVFYRKKLYNYFGNGDVINGRKKEN